MAGRLSLTCARSMVVGKLYTMGQPTGPTQLQGWIISYNPWITKVETIKTVDLGYERLQAKVHECRLKQALSVMHSASEAAFVALYK